MELFALLLVISGLVALALWLWSRNSTQTITSDVHRVGIEELQETPTEEGISRAVLWLAFAAREVCRSGQTESDFRAQCQAYLAAEKALGHPLGEKLDKYLGDQARAMAQERSPSRTLRRNLECVQMSRRILRQLIEEAS